MIWRGGRDKEGKSHDVGLGERGREKLFSCNMRKANITKIELIALRVLRAAGLVIEIKY
jgi:hypothetical protein